MTSWFEDAINGLGRILESSRINPIEPGSGPRRTWLKTRIVKKELGLASKRSISLFEDWFSDEVPFSCPKSRLIVTFPLAMIILSRVPVCPSAASPWDWGTEFPALLPKSKSSESAKQPSNFFCMVLILSLIARLKSDESITQHSSVSNIWF